MQNPQVADPTGGETRTDALPVRVRIPSISVDSGLESLGRDATGAIEAPRDFGSAGWYRDGVVPGDTGPAVIAGHIDSAVGPAVFYSLSSLTPGARVDVELSDSTVVSFMVDSVIQAPKNAFPTAAVYGPTPDAQLRLVTCGGAFDDASGHYVDNVVVFATLAR
jgi:sortase (surface protein transpeptidase)